MVLREEAEGMGMVRDERAAKAISALSSLMIVMGVGAVNHLRVSLWEASAHSSVQDP